MAAVAGALLESDNREMQGYSTRKKFVTRQRTAGVKECVFGGKEESDRDIS